jgi:predicted outer membrane protein
MVTEKMAAAIHESGRLALGASTKSVVKRYSKRVNANVRRLSRQQRNLPS